MPKLVFAYVTADNKNENDILLCTSFGFVSKFEELFCLHFRHRSHQRVLGKGRMQFPPTQSLLQLAS